MGCNGQLESLVCEKKPTNIGMKCDKRESSNIIYKQITRNQGWTRPAIKTFLILLEVFERFLKESSRFDLAVVK